MNEELVLMLQRQRKVEELVRLGQLHYNACRFHLAVRYWKIAKKLQWIIEWHTI